MARTLKVLLTGGNGYLGEYIKKFLGTKEVEIFLLNRNHIKEMIEDKSFKSNIIPKSFSCNILNFKFDLLIHGAAISAEDSLKYKDKIDLINVGLTNYLAKYCQIKNTFFLFLSSVQVYGEELNGIYSEFNKLNPYSLYSRSKASAEKKLINKFESNLLHGCILRIGNVVGRPITTNSSGWELFANSAIIDSIFKRKIIIRNNSNIRRNFVSIKLLLDFLNYLIILLKKDIYHLPSIINITSNNSLTLYEFACKIMKFNKEIFKNNVSIFLQNDLINMVPFSNISNKKLKTLIPNSFNYEIDEIIYQTIKYYYDN